ncbi:MAG: dihydroorotase [Bacteroidetes bacterium]|nr:dihydroorotase [Bacteroidota bacterium]MCL5033788.1 dihydroorotase [Bacteroidota bacterium]
MKIYLKNARVVDLTGRLDGLFNIMIVDGRIQEIGTALGGNPVNYEINLQGKFVVPGLFDMHTHLREPGQEYKEDIASGIAAAANGGFTGIAAMPNTDPVVDSADVVKYVLDRARQSGLVDLHQIAAITESRKGERLSEMKDLAEAGAIAFSDDGSAVTNSQVMRRALEYSSMLNKVIIQHCEDPELTRSGSANESAETIRYGLKTQHRLAEELILARDLKLVEAFGGKYHATHISTSESVEVITDAKRRGLPITCDVTPHHLFLDDSILSSYDSDYKVNPPLRTKHDCEALVEGLKSGVIDAIASDHAPHAIHEKEVEFDAAPFGMIGLETTVGAVMTKLYHEQKMDIHKIASLLCANPRRILGLPIPVFELGAKAELTIIDPDCEWTVNPNEFKSKSRNTGFKGWRFKGSAVGIINDEKFFFSDRLR